MKKLVMIFLVLLVSVNSYAGMASPASSGPCRKSSKGYFIASGAFFVLSLAEFVQSNNQSQKAGEYLKTAEENLSLYGTTGSSADYDKSAAAYDKYNDYFHSKDLSFALGVLSLGVSAYLFTKGYSIYEKQKKIDKVAFDFSPKYAGLTYSKHF